MAREFARTDRVSQQVHKEVASIINHEFKHEAPGLAMITVSGVDVSRDLAYAKVYVTLFESDPALVKETMATLDEAKGFIRGLLGRRVKMRNTPALRFILDSSISEGMRISNLVSQARREDASKSGEAPGSAEQDEHNSDS